VCAGQPHRQRLELLADLIEVADLVVRQASHEGALLGDDADEVIERLSRIERAVEDRLAQGAVHRIAEVTGATASHRPWDGLMPYEMYTSQGR